MSLLIFIEYTWANSYFTPTSDFAPYQLTLALYLALFHLTPASCFALSNAQYLHQFFMQKFSAEFGVSFAEFRVSFPG